MLKTYRGALATLLLCLALTAAAAVATYEAERKRVIDLLERRAEAQERAIQVGIRDRLTALSVVRGLNAGADELTDAELRSLVRHVPVSWDGVTAIGWLVEEGASSLSVDVCRPAVSCRRIPWGELAAAPGATDALRRARTTDRLIAVGPLVPEKRDVKPLHLIVSGVSAYEDIADLQVGFLRFRGYIAGLLSVGDLLKSILDENAVDLGLDAHVYEPPGRGAEGLLHFHASRFRSTPAEPKPQPEIRSALHFERTVELADLRLVLLLQPTDDAVAELRSGLPATALAVGLLATAAFTGYSWSAAQRQRRLAHAVDRARTDLGTANSALDERSTELAAANDLLSGIVDASPVAILALDPAANVLLWNPAAERVFGYARSEVIGRPHPVVPPDQLESFQQLLRRVMAGDALRDIDVLRQRKDGVRIELRASGGALRDRDGRPIGAVYVIEDLTERRNVERQLAQAQKMEAVGQLTGGVAHDFNNLLQVILGCADMLLERLPMGDEQRSIAEMMQSAAERGAGLTRQLLAFSRRQPLEPERLDANEVVRTLEPLLRRTLGEAVALQTMLAPDLGLSFVDRGQLESALVNLAVNARDAMPSGGRLIIETGNMELDADYAARRTEVIPGEYVMIGVTDTGVGMRPEVLARIFEPFFTTKPAGKGTGLGLSMVFGFIKQSKGHVSAYSEVGHGTTLRLYLPRTLDAGEAAARSAGASVECELARSGPARTILYVEDDPEVRRFGLLQLAALGYEAIEASNSGEAIAALASPAQIDLLFTDVVLGDGMSGWDLSQKAQAMRPGLAVLFAPGYNEAMMTGNGMLKAGVHMLRKPYRRADLGRKLAEILDAVGAA